MIFNFEKKLIEFIEKNLYVVFGVVISLLAVVVRMGLGDVISNDAKNCLLPWFDEIKSNGGLKSLSMQVGDYGILYQTIIALFTYIPLPAIASYKILSCLFDFIMALGCCLIVKEIYNDKLKIFLTYFAVIFSPIVIINSSAWGQCDSIFTAFCILALYAALKEKYLVTFILYGIACTFKLQAVFFLPFLLFLYFVKKKFSIFYFTIIPIEMIILSMGGILNGRGLFDVFKVYLNQSSEYKMMVLNYPSVWSLISNAYGKYRLLAFVISIVLCGVLFFYFINKKYEINKNTLLWIAFLSVYIIVLTMPSMHERYGYLYEILAIVVMIMNKKTLFLWLGLQLLSLSTYAVYVVGESFNMHILAVLNIVIFMCYLVLFLRTNAPEQVEEESMY